ncbi:DNA-processing protein DprA [Thermoproteota archaeon]
MKFEPDNGAEITKESIKNRLKTYDADAYQERLNQEKIGCLFYDSDYYPAILKEISDPPLVLYYKGRPEILHTDYLGVVGPRAASDYGKAVTSRLVRDVLPYFGIVSGLAKGIDTCAHETALHYSGRTAAVVGTGLDQVYPQSNLKLFNRIIEKGCVVSEYPPGIGPKAFHFPQRNRIIAGLSKGVLVCEANEKSGALITARLAGDYGREVFAVPGSIFSSSTVGPHKLIQTGAKLVTGYEDIVNEFNYLFRAPRKSLFSQSQENNRVEFSGTSCHDAKDILGEMKTDQLTQDEKNVLSAVGFENQGIETILKTSRLEIQKVLPILTVLEINGLIEQFPGKQFRRRS